MKKRYIFLGVIVAAAAIGYHYFSLESIVKKVVHKYGSEVTGTDVNLGGFSLSFKDGSGKITGLEVGNPKGYDTPYLLTLGEVSVKVDLKSLTTDTIVIDQVLIKKPVITYEMLSLTQNNIKQIQQNIAKNTSKVSAEANVENKPVKADEKPKTTSEKSKKVVIKLVNITGGEIKASAAIPGKSQEISVALPEIKIEGIGESKKGENIPQVIARILNQILSTATQTVIKSNLGDLKGVAEENLNNVVGGVKDRVKNLGIFGK